MFVPSLHEMSQVWLPSANAALIVRVPAETVTEAELELSTTRSQVSDAALSETVNVKFAVVSFEYAPFEGELRFTDGTAVSATVTLNDALTAFPWLSVTVAVIGYTPVERRVLFWICPFVELILKFVVSLTEYVIAE